ncbi:MAG TPA: YdcF family protein [Gemmatimonadaceae bacterium]
MQLGAGPILGGALAQSVVLTCGAIGLLLAFVGYAVVMLVLDALLLAIFLVVANTSLMSAAAKAWVRNDPLPSHADAIVVLSAGINSSGALKDDGVSRLLTGLELFQRGIAPRLFTTAIGEKFGSAIVTSTVDQARLVKLGGATAAWTSIADVHITHDEAIKTAALLANTGKAVVVVTSPLHTRRACATFEVVGLKVSCAPSTEQEFAAWHPRTSRERLATFRQYAYERLGMVKYAAHGWVAKR